MDDPAITSKRIVLTAVGSLGDLYPYLAIGVGLRARGHETVIATSECYRPKRRETGAWLPAPAT